MINDPSLDMFNVAANVATFVGGVFGGAVIIYVLIQVRKIAERLEQVIAPKTGIENHLVMCSQVVECDPDGTCIVGDDGVIVLVNKSMEDISGYHRSQLVGQSVEILVPDMVKGMHPERHCHDFSELQSCCFVNGSLHALLMDAHPELGRNGGQKCDVVSGPCSCGGWH